MAQTIKPVATLLSDMADGGDNTAEEVRDGIVSMFPYAQTQYSEVPSASWSWVNQNSATISVVNTVQLVNTPAVGGTNILGRVRTAPSTPYTITALLSGQIFNSDAGYGLWFRESSTSELTIMYLKPAGCVVENWNSPTSFNGAVASKTTYGQSQIWMQLEDDGTDLFFRIGGTGDDAAMIQVGTQGRTAFMAGGPDQVGFALRDLNNATAVALHSWDEA